MTENNKKRGNSFRKIFPNIFFSNKNKERSSIKDTSAFKLKSGGTSKSNQYQNPKFVIDKYESRTNQTEENDERIYENLSTAAFIQNANDSNSNNDLISNNSSSSTLVSEKVENVRYPHNTITSNEKHVKYMARPQVPPKPHQEVYGSPVLDKHQKIYTRTQYPDVYYHSVEKLTDKISPLDEIEIYRASQAAQAQAHPASVGAEIKKVSTKFLISPKKEAEVRTIQPIRARSLSLDKNSSKIVDSSRKSNKENYFEKPYNYSAPTSPIAVGHKIPNMPTTVSPYERVKQNMVEAEEKRNSLSRSSSRNKSSPSPRLFYQDVSKSPTSSNYPTKAEDSLKKEKTRQRVEAFYWQKIKELKEREDEYLLRHSLRNSLRESRTHYASYSNSNCSTPTSFTADSRSCSLPRGREFNYQTNKSSPFSRGAPERRTDSYIKPSSYQANQDPVQYRNTEIYGNGELYGNVTSRNHLPIFQRGSLTSRTSNVIQQPKRVSFEENRLPAQTTHVQQNVRFSEVQCKKDHSSELDTVKFGLKNQGYPPLPPIRTTSVLGGAKSNRLVNSKNVDSTVGATRSVCSESESGSEAGEIQRIMHENSQKEEDWQGDPRIDGGLSDGEASRGPTRGRPSRREDPRRHTLAGNHNIYMHHHHPAAHISTIEIERYNKAQELMNMPEYATVNKYRDMKTNRSLDPRMKRPHMTHYPQTNNALFDDDPGVMSEVETSSTGFRRGGKQRSSLPVVRTPSKTLERPLGLVFLQYRSETKRALLPNEITSIDTVKALFVRSFPKQLTMQYMDSAHVKIYIHDSSKDMFYELEDVRAHLRDIRDRSVLRLFEATDIGGGAFPGVVGVGSVPMPPGADGCASSTCWDQDQNYFSEPEIDSDYHHQHVHNKSKIKAPAYYMGTSTPSTLPRGGSLMRAFSPAAPPIPADRGKTPGSSAPSKPVRSYVPGSGSERCFPAVFAAAECPRGTDQLYSIPAHTGDGYMSSPERVAPRVPYEEPYYTQFLGPAAGRGQIAPVIDEEANETVIIDDTYQMYGVNAITTAPRPMPRPPYDARLGAPVDDMQRLRVEKMERQLANLTGLVQKALQAPGAAPPVTPREDYQPYPSTSRATATTQDAARFSSNERPPKLGRDRFQKSVSFEKSVSFSDDPPDMNSPKQHSPQHSADTKPTKPAIKSSTLPRTSSQERDRLKPAPPPKPAGLVGQQLTLVPPRTYVLNVTHDFFNQLRVLQKQSRDLRIETRNLRRSTLSHSIQMRQMMADTILKIGAVAATFSEEDPESQLTREEEIYRQDMLLLENDLYELEATVERLRGQAANRETRVNMADIERIAMVLSKSSKTVADWKLKFPILQQTMKAKLAAEMEKVVRKEKMLEEEPERLELALRRCKKLTGTLVTLKRLACVQEQRLPIADGRISPTSSQSSTATAGPSSEEYTSENACHVAPNANKGGVGGRGAAACGAADVRAENALDALLDELQTFAKPAERGGRGEGALRRLHSYPSGSDTDASPPVRARGQHPPKPPVPERHPELLALAVRRAPPPPPPRTTSRSPLASPTSPCSPPAPRADRADPADHADDAGGSRQALLEHRHQELLKKQRALQEQYARLQMIQRSGPSLPPNAQPDLKKTGSESNLLTKMNLNLAPASISGSMTHLAGDCDKNRNDTNPDKCSSLVQAPDAVATTNKVYETDIL